MNLFFDTSALVKFYHNEVGTEAENLLKIYGKTYGLRTLDALHLAAFSLISESDWTFVTADIQQNEVAKEMNITTILPIR